MTIIQSSPDAAVIESKLRDFIGENFFIDDELDSLESLTAAGVIDSTGVLELVAWIEETLAFDVPDADILPENLDTIASIVRYIKGGLRG